MSYVTHTEKVKNAIAEVKDYPLVNLEINVNGSACLLVKYKDGKYYEQCLPREEMKQSVEVLSNLIVNRVESYFNGWGAKQGFKR
jgi:antitoxin component HigA of HigAB toxin-antitoxin module